MEHPPKVSPNTEAEEKGHDSVQHESEVENDEHKLHDVEMRAPTEAGQEVSSGKGFEVGIKAVVSKLMDLLSSNYTELSKHKEEAEAAYVEAIEKATVKLQNVARGDSHAPPKSSPPSSAPSGVSTPSEFEIDLNAKQDLENITHKKEIEYKTKHLEDGEWKTDEETDEQHMAHQQSAGTGPDQSPAFSWKETKDKSDKTKSIEVVIYCQNLRRVLAKELNHVPWVHWTRSRPTFHNPFPDFVFNWDTLSKTADRLSVQGSCGMHLRNLLNLIKETNQVKRFFDVKDHEPQERTCHYLDLELLFRPGDIVFANIANQPQAFLLFRCLYSARRSRNGHVPGCFGLFVWRYDFDGSHFNRKPFFFKIPSFDDPQSITTLPCYPLSFHPDEKTTRKFLIERGRNFRHACIQDQEKRMFHYSGNLHYMSQLPEDLFEERYAGSILEGSVIGFQIGHALRQDEEDWPVTDVENAHDKNVEESFSRTIPYSGPVLVDPELYRLYGPLLAIERKDIVKPPQWRMCECVQCKNNKSMNNVLKTGYDNFGKDNRGWRDFDDNQLLICPPRVEGFALSNKKWVFLDVRSEYLQVVTDKDVAGNIDASPYIAFNRMILPSSEHWKETKDVIQNLVQVHGKNVPKNDDIPDPFADLIEGKGQGLTVLLYGTSGVGKTLMAESVTEITGRPLIKVSFADIGIVLTSVEKTLDKLFHMAERWGAVLLFDEADILLEQRKSAASIVDMTHNAIVGVFLKVLDYYKGILLLTTNRLMPFDTAVLSRIHLAIEFPAFDIDGQRAMMSEFLSTVKSTAVEKREVSHWIRSHADDEFNGRQIRNVFSAAINLARAKRRKLEQADLDIFWQRTKAFHHKMEKTIMAAEMASLPK